MSNAMKKAVIVIRLLLGALFLFASVAYFFKLVPQPELQGNIKAFNEGLMASGYLMPFIKITELLCGLAFITGRFNTLASVAIFPITINIFLYHLVLDPKGGLPLAIFVLLANLFIAYYYRANYKSLFAAK
jgi:uncharacterized membrane protein YphA (DoxX/SURF4 family)